MKTEITGSPSFACIHVDLDRGESIIAESGAMSSMSAELDMNVQLNGGFFSAICKVLFGRESFFLSRFTNNTAQSKRVTLTQGIPGNIHEVELMENDSLCFQPGAYVASTPEVKLTVKWAGFASGIAREGFFKLEVSGPGKIWYGAYGDLWEKQIDGEYIVDTSHLVAYQPQLQLKVQLAGGIFSSFFGGEGLVTRVEGKGVIVLQTRSICGLASWLAPKL